MYNPSYLVKSRHDIFYFRYPLPIKPLQGKRSPRVCVSLKTRCPKEALSLAKALEYHSSVLIDELDLERMDHNAVMSVMKSYYAGLLESRKAKIDAEGPLPKKKVQSISNILEELNMVIGDGEYDDPTEYYGVEYENPEDDPLKEDISKIMAQNDLRFAPDSKEYQMMKSAHKYLRRNYYNDLLAYNRGVTDFSFLDKGQNTIKLPVNHYKPEHRLGKVIESYMTEIKSNITKRSYNEQYDCLNYLTDWLGADFPIGKIDDAKAREVKELLIKTPNGRNKNKLTKGRSLLEQIEIAGEHKLKPIGGASVNKYLAYFESLCKWAQKGRYISQNPFVDMRVKVAKKKDRRRDMFNKDEVKQIISGLGDGTPDKLIKNKSNYWGALIAVYTGARRNEIAALLPDDVKQDETTGIWYFDITDDEEQGKELKTAAAKRIVPIHSGLIDLGFLEFVEESRAMKSAIRHEEGREPRLLYDLTYTDHEKWGRNLGRWFNEKYLKALGLKTGKKTMHSLRHSFITFLSAAGVEYAHIKAVVGHEPGTVTDQTYAHYGLDHLPAFKEAIEKLSY